MSTVSASIVTYRTSPEILERLLRCVEKSEISRIWIIDHSPDDSLKKIIPPGDRFEYLHRKNLGYGAGNNVGMRKSLEQGFDYHVVLNPDVFWEDDVIGELTAFMDHNPDVALSMPRVYYPGGKYQYQAKLLPRPIDLFFKRFGLGKIGSRRAGYYELRDVDHDKIINAPFLSGCFMFLRNSALREVGLFDERFFMYHEDMDLSRRLHRSHRTVYYPKVSIYHNLERASTKSFRLFMIHVANMIRYYNKWGWFLDREGKMMNRACRESLHENVKGE